MTSEELKHKIVRSLESLGVRTAGTYDDPLRWSYTDLATDLAPLLHREMESGWFRKLWRRILRKP